MTRDKNIWIFRVVLRYPKALGKITSMLLHVEYKAGGISVHSVFARMQIIYYLFIQTLQPRQSLFLVDLQINPDHVVLLVWKHGSVQYMSSFCTGLSTFALFGFYWKCVGIHTTGVFGSLAARPTSSTMHLRCTLSNIWTGRNFMCPRGMCAGHHFKLEHTHTLDLQQTTDFKRNHETGETAKNKTQEIVIWEGLDELGQ